MVDDVRDKSDLTIDDMLALFCNVLLDTAGTSISGVGGGSDVGVDALRYAANSARSSTPSPFTSACANAGSTGRRGGSWIGGRVGGGRIAIEGTNGMTGGGNSSGNGGDEIGARLASLLVGSQ